MTVDLCRNPVSSLCNSKWFLMARFIGHFPDFSTYHNFHCKSLTISTMKSFSPCKKERCDRLHSMVVDMNHEDRLKLANRKRAQGTGENYFSCYCLSFYFVDTFMSFHNISYQLVLLPLLSR